MYIQACINLVAYLDHVVHTNALPVLRLETAHVTANLLMEIEEREIASSLLESCVCIYVCTRGASTSSRTCIHMCMY